MKKTVKSDIRQGVNVIGFFKGALGLGESARMVIKALEAQGIPVVAVSADSFLPDNLIQGYHSSLSEKLLYPINLFCIDIRYIPDYISKVGWQHFEYRYNIASWFWESNLIPDQFRAPWPYIDEFWVSTRYIQEHLAAATSIPVTHISQPLTISYIPSTNSKSRFNLDNKFTYLFCFHFYSMMERKNPLAIVEAFQKAFPENNDVQLVIKSHGGSEYQHQLDKCLKAIKGDSRIRWIDKGMDYLERFDLMNACDCYVSLHRTEGFGLTLAETMLLEKPVIATSYSGNLDFTKDDNSYLCSYKFVKVGPGVPPYPKEGIWADVDIDQAASLMRQVLENPKEAQERAQKGKKFILANHSLEAIGKQMSKRLSEIIPLQHSKTPPWHYTKGRIVYHYTRFIKPIRKQLRPVKKAFKTILRKLYA